MKKRIKLAIVISLVAALLCTAASAATFSDVSKTASYAEAVEYVSSTGLMVGYGDGKFGPEKTVTRAEMATVLCKLLGEDKNLKKDGSKFKDVPTSHWGNAYVIKAASLGILSGYGNGKFGPDDTVTYEQALTMIVNMLGYGDKAGEYGGYPSGYIYIGHMLGVMTYIDSSLGNRETRGNIALMLFNLRGCPIVKDKAKSDIVDFANSLEGTYFGWNRYQMDTDFDKRTISYVYAATRQEGYATAIDTFKVTYRYDAERGWYISSPVKVTYGKETWNVEGTWIYRNSESDITLTIHKITENEVKYEYDFKYKGTKQSSDSMTNYEFKSKRVATAQMSSNYGAYYENKDGFYFTLCDGAESVYITKYGGVSYGGRVWIDWINWIEGQNFFILTKEDDLTYSRAVSNELFPVVQPLFKFGVVDRTGGSHFDGTYSHADDISKMTYYETYSYMNKENPASTSAETFDIYGKYEYVSGTVFLGEFAEVGDQGTFKIYGDGKLLYQYNASDFTREDCSEDFVVDVGGVRELTLEMSGGHCIEKMSGVKFDRPTMYAANINLSQKEPYRMYAYYDTSSSSTYNWIESESTLLEGLSYFYQKTGVRPYIAMFAYDDQMYTLDSNYDYVLSDYAKQMARDRCGEAVGDAPFFALCYFAEEDDTEKRMGGKYILFYSTSAKELLAGKVSEFWDCFKDPQMDWSKFEERFSLAFESFAKLVEVEKKG